MEIDTIISAAGNVLEWYDFALYGFFSDTIAQVFFPPSSSEHNLIYSYLVFGGAFVMRPIGGLITGHIGDKYGRKKALVFSLFCMSIPTVALGLLPTYAQVGGWSTALLIICRMMQGFSVGGQLPSTLVYTLERRPKEHWGYYGSFVNLAANFGVILGNLVGALIRQLVTPEQLLQWGWRVAFLSGITILPVAFYLKLCGKEHHPNEGHYDDENELVSHDQDGEGIAGLSESQRKHPLREAVKRENWPALLSSILVPMLYGGGYYLSVVWMAIFMSELIEPPVPGSFWVNLGANVFGLTLTSFFTGWLSDRVGRVKLMSFGAISTGIVAPVMVWLISESGGKVAEALFAQLCLTFFFSFYCGPFCAWLVERFPVNIRLTSVSLGFNIGICISSGFSPALATWLVTFSPPSPGFIFTAFAGLGLLGMFISTKVHTDGGIDEDDASVGKLTAVEDDLSTALL
mmetsp:Transcript_7663/g.11366  ORF Transcript_7663/g.11366 Transcript_7663/m.11366 type:complete len:460 (-) Transcript_7663:34-1413(-)